MSIYLDTRVTIRIDRHLQQRMDVAMQDWQIWSKSLSKYVRFCITEQLKKVEAEKAAKVQASDKTPAGRQTRRTRPRVLSAKA